jgi:phage baseplate assembly protein W
MIIQGSTLSFPFRPDVRGTLATISKKSAIIGESIRLIIETRQGERVMLPDYGIPDFVFEVMDAGFTARLAYFIEQQIRRYEPLVDQVKARIGFIDDERFTPGFTEDAQIAAVQVEYIERGSNTPQNLVFPTWQLREGLTEAL